MYLQLFSTCLYLLLKEHISSLTQVTIDIEYPDHDAQIKLHLLNLLRRAGLWVEADKIGFDQIHRGGKKPAAHDKAYFTRRGDIKPDRVITLDELLKEFK